jgi:starch phosphorylase
VAAGSDDLCRAAAGLAAKLPPSLGGLARVAYNYRWAWHPDGPSLFRALDAPRFERCGENPVRLLQELPASVAATAAANGDVLARAASVAAAIEADLARPAPSDRTVAFFCPEYGVHESLPIYSGGLGALSGDFLKEASDRALPLVAVGLLYRQGYFRQRLDVSGWQHEAWDEVDPDLLPGALVTGAGGDPLVVRVPIGEREISAQIWRVDVGRVPLLLLDAARPENDPVDRWITSRLYIADREMRLAQYALLGIGGVRALAAVGVEPEVLHLNEGHAALAALELARAAVRGGASLERALAAAREQVVFTTHTPVPAGNDTYQPHQAAAALAGIARELGADAGDLIRLGRTHPGDDTEPFGVTQFALRTSRAANGVSRRHGKVAREMWHAVADAAAITHVTNGVHLPTWLGAPMRHVLDRYLGADWLRRTADPDTWEALDAVPAGELWAARAQQRSALVAYVRERATADRLARGEPRAYVEAAARGFDPDVLTIGFARRLATYKRLWLLAQDPGRALALLAGDRPLQLVLAGKAHPSDDEAKRVIQALFAHKGASAVAERVVYLHDYDLRTAARLVQGCDLWVNLPRPPLEASGTSGMKSAVNGGLQLSVLDGWWAEAFDGDNGWALAGDVDPDHGAQDARDAAALYDALASEVVPAFYDRDERGIPRAWLRRMRASIRSIAPAFAATRMVDDYEQRVYRPVATGAVSDR